MADPIDIRQTIHLPPDDTVRTFAARDELRLTTKWSEMWHDDHARAFTVAKIAKLDLLDTIRNSLADVLANGGTFEQWQKNIVPDLQRAGWWGRVQDRSLTGTDEAIHVGPRRLRNIFDANLRVSRAGGKWARIQELKDVAPYLAYSAVGDGRARPLHALWGGLAGPPRVILHVDHAWWDTHFPPCDWGCRCDTIQLSARDLKRRGWAVTEGEPPSGPPSKFFRAGATKPEEVPAGIGPGWAYNPGKAGLLAIADKAVATLERTAAHDTGMARDALRDLVDSPVFLKALSEPGTSFPVMVLDAETAALIGSDARVAVHSADTIAKQRRHHPELPIERYRQLPDVGAGAEIVARDGERVLVLVKGDDGKWLVSVLKRTQSGKGLFLTSLRVQDGASLARLLRGKEIVRDGRAG